MQPLADNSIMMALLWGGAVYALVLGGKLMSFRKGDPCMLGVGLLIGAACWMLLHLGVEVHLPITVTLPEGTKVIEVPIIRTLSEMGFVVAVAALAMVLVSAAAITMWGSDLIRLNKAVVRTLVFFGGLTLIWQLHFAGQFSIHNLLIGVGGASVFVIGLGLQRTLGNLFSGFDLQADKVVKKGDWVQLGVGGPEGIVTDTSLRTTRVLTNEGQMLIIANGDLLARTLFNLDQPNRTIRVRRTISLSYSVPPMKAKDAILSVLRQDQGVLKTPLAPSPEVLVLAYGDSAINYDIRFWVPDRRAMDEIVDRVMARIWYALREQGIEIPFPIRTLRMVDMHKEAQESAATVRIDEHLERSVVQCPMFAEQFLSSGERRELVRDSSEQRLHPGEFAVRRGEMSDHMYLILEGGVEVKPEGRPVVELAAPAWFGEIALLRGEPRSADVVGGAHGARLLRMSRLSVLPALQRNPKLAGELARVSNERREAAGIQDAAEARTTVFVRLSRVVKEFLGEMRTW